MKTKIWVVVLVSLLVISVVSTSILIAANDKAKPKAPGNAKAPPEIESITHIFYRYPTHAGPGPHPDDESDTYHFTRGGLRWFDFPVEYEVDPTGSGDVDGDGDTDSDDADAAEAAVEAGFEGSDSWDDYDPFGDFFVKGDSDGDGDVDGTVSWDGIDGTGGAVAMATIWFYPWSKEIISFEIVFDVAESWGILSSTPYPYAGATAFDIQNVGAHEVGHVVGLGHVNAPKDGLLTMYRYTTEGETLKRDLGLGDQLGVFDLY